MRVVRSAGELEAAYERCASEAAAAFGNGDLYVEQLIERARHIEVQIIGDGESVAHLGERECTLQRQNQKIVEIAPSPTLTPDTRQAVCDAAVEMARAVGYRSLGTWEFLIDADDPSTIAFCEVNARIQVEHTVTEEVTGVDLVAAQLRIAGGARLADVGLVQPDVPSPRGYAIQCRVNTETMQPDGTSRPSGGVLTAFEPPTGPGLRTDTYGYVGYGTNPSFDSLLAKVIAYSPSRDYADAVRRARRALGEFRIDGVATNLGFLAALLDRPEVTSNELTTSFVADHAEALCTAAAQAASVWAPAEPAAAAGAGGRAGATVGDDPLAVLHHGDIDDAPADRAASDAVRAQAMASGTASLHGVPVGDRDRPRRQHRSCGSAAGHDRLARCRRRRSRRRGPAGRGDGSDEDGARRDLHGHGHRANAGRGALVTRCTRGTRCCSSRRPRFPWSSPKQPPRSISTTSGPIWPKCSTAAASASTRTGPTPLPSVTVGATARRARTWPTSSMRARSWSTAR